MEEQIQQEKRNLFGVGALAGLAMALPSAMAAADEPCPCPCPSPGGLIDVVADHGAVGNGVADDTAAIQAAVDAAGADHTVWFPPGNYKTTRTITVASNGVHLLGAGVYSTRIQFYPAAGETDAILFSMGASIQFSCSLRSMAIRVHASGNHLTHALRAVDQSLFVATDLLITNPHNGSNGIGIRLEGRESCTIERIYSLAYIPLYVGCNPNTTNHWLSADHLYIGNTVLRALDQVDSKCLFIEDGANISNMTVDGSNAWVGGGHGLYHVDTLSAAAGVSLQLNIKGVRREQTMDSQHWAIYIDRQAHRLQGLSVRDWYGDGGAKGLFLRGIDRIHLENTHVHTPHLTLDIDDCRDLCWHGFEVRHDAQILLGDLHQISAEPRRPGHRWPLFAFFTRQLLTYQQKPAELFGTSRWAHAQTLAPGGRINLPLGSVDQGVQLAMVHIAAQGPGIVEAGYWIAAATTTPESGSNGIKLLHHTGNCDIGDKPGKLCLYSEAGALTGSVAVLNNLSVPCEVIIDLVFKRSPGAT